MNDLLSYLKSPITDSLDLGILIVDPQYNILHVNSWLLEKGHFTKEDLLFKNLFSCFEIKKQGLVKTIINDVIEHSAYRFLSQMFHKYIFPIETTDIHKNPITMQQNVKLYPIEDLDGKRLCLIYIKDITDMVLYENQLVEKNKALFELNQNKNKMLSMCSHDLKNPIGNILTIFQMMETMDIPPEDQKRMLKIINDHAAYAFELIKAILDLGKIESQGLQLEKEKAFIIQKLFTLVESQRFSFEDKEINLLIENDLADDSLEIEIDNYRLEQVFRNILSNAKQYVDAGGYAKIKISLLKAEKVNFSTTADEVLQIAFSNDGPPIPEHKINSIFNKYEQVKPSTKGTEVGLGLAISKEIVQLHGGDIFVESNPEETSFFIQLPLFVQEAGV